jgi:hypothetical protein
LLAQDSPVAQFAKAFRTDVAALSSEPQVAVWQKAHPGSRLQLAHYQTEKDSYETGYKRANRWCAASVVASQSSVVGTVLFDVPAVTAGALRPLPEKVDKSLTQTCLMQAVWFQTSSVVGGMGGVELVDAIVNELIRSWGKPNGSTDGADIQGGGSWKGVVAWHRSGINIWVAYAPPWAAGPSSATLGRVIAFARRNSPPDSSVNIWLLGGALVRRVIAEAVRISDLDTALAEAMMRRSFCMQDPESTAPTRYPFPTPEADAVTVGRAVQWLRQAKSLPPERRAAALLVVDAYLSCVQSSPSLTRAIGAEAAGDPEQGYSHYFRDQAEKLDSQGPAGELAGLASLADPCFLKGKAPWPDLEIKKGEALLQRFPADTWTPWIHYAVARSHAVKLSFSYPEGDPEGDILPLKPAEMQTGRELAIDHFKEFLKQLPDDPKAVFAWQEAWRLLAGLPPSYIGFGCSGE